MPMATHVRECPEALGREGRRIFSMSPQVIEYACWCSPVVRRLRVVMLKILSQSNSLFVCVCACVCVCSSLVAVFFCVCVPVFFLSVFPVFSVSMSVPLSSSVPTCLCACVPVSLFDSVSVPTTHIRPMRRPKAAKAESWETPPVSGLCFHRHPSRTRRYNCRRKYGSASGRNPSPHPPSSLCELLLV